MNEEIISRFLISVELKNESREVLLINGLYGFIDVIDENTSALIKKWNRTGIRKEEDIELYDKLKKRKYITSKESEEIQFERLVKILDGKRKKAINNFLSATFILSYRCNFKCPYCFEKDIDRNSPIMSKEQVNAVLDLYPNHSPQKICFYGGEPFLPEHREIIYYIIEKNPSSEFLALTNGYYLEEYTELFKGKKVRQIQVTLDGDKEEHNRTRILKNGGGSFDKILRGIEKCIDYRIPIKIRMNITYDNINSCLALKKKLTDKYGSTNLLSFDMQELFQYQGKMKRELTERLLMESNNGKRNIILDNMPRVARFFYNGQPIAPTIIGCESSIANRFYDPYGRIYTCFTSVGHPERAVGTYAPYYELKEKSILKRSAYEIEACRKCSCIFLCGGGCSNALYDENDGDIYKPNCATMKDILEHVIPFLYCRGKENESISCN